MFEFLMKDMLLLIKAYVYKFLNLSIDLLKHSMLKTTVNQSYKLCMIYINAYLAKYQNFKHVNPASY